MTELSESRAKLVRARKHIETFELEQRWLETNTYSTRLEYDEETGWATIYFGIDVPVEQVLALSALAGDIVHNLRSALDYIVTELVAVSGTTLHNRHQFPIFDDRQQFEKHVGTSQTNLKSRGPLGGTTLGFELIERYQPYQRGDRRAARVDVLQSLHRLSIADKHRSILNWWPMHQPSGVFDFGGAEVLQWRGMAYGTHLAPPTDRANNERPVLQARLSAPPTNYEFKGTLSIFVNLTSQAIDGEIECTWGSQIFQLISERVGLVIDLFEQIL